MLPRTPLLDLLDAVSELPGVRQLLHAAAYAFAWAADDLPDEGDPLDAPRFADPNEMLRRAEVARRRMAAVSAPPGPLKDALLARIHERIPPIATTPKPQPTMADVARAHRAAQLPFVGLHLTVDEHIQLQQYIRAVEHIGQRILGENDVYPDECSIPHLTPALRAKIVGGTPGDA